LAWLKPEIARAFTENSELYGAKKVWRQLNPEGIAVARCSVERLMQDMDLQVVVVTSVTLHGQSG
jgi:transposase InsO family protein